MQVAEKTEMFELKPKKEKLNMLPYPRVVWLSYKVQNGITFNKMFFVIKHIYYK